MLRFFKFFAALLIAVAFAGFAAANRGMVSLRFFPLPYAVDMPQFLLALLCFALGAAAGRLALGLSLHRARRLIRLERQRVEALEHELALLRQKKQAAMPAIPAQS
ncbi:MAG: DUF1049 domain-containing protein [Pseudomonadota bacterium]|nr:DUF1049 domain-containing protein [Pseudomonadota bacterium]MDE3037294.1 DUF1049 domain-containing protein [Pseudomonadota bacterium]